MIKSESIYPGIELLLLGTSLEPCGTDSRFHTSKDVWNKLNVCKKFEGICDEFGLPERIAHETIRIMMKKNRHWYSERNQIKTFLWVLNQDYRYLYKARAIKEKYAAVTCI